MVSEIVYWVREKLNSFQGIKTLLLKRDLVRLWGYSDVIFNATYLIWFSLVQGLMKSSVDLCWTPLVGWRDSFGICA